MSRVAVNQNNFFPSAAGSTVACFCATTMRQDEAIQKALLCLTPHAPFSPEMTTMMILNQQKTLTDNVR